MAPGQLTRHCSTLQAPRGAEKSESIRGVRPTFKSFEMFSAASFFWIEASRCREIHEISWNMMMHSVCGCVSASCLSIHKCPRPIRTAIEAFRPLLESCGEKGEKDRSTEFQEASENLETSGNFRVRVPPKIELENNRQPWSHCSWCFLSYRL